MGQVFEFRFHSTSSLPLGHRYLRYDHKARGRATNLASNSTLESTLTRDVGLTSTFHRTMRAQRGICSITAEAAGIIFQAKNQAGRQKQDKLATRLAAEFNISPKAVRDIWCLRTWTHATRPHWRLADEQRYLEKQMCVSCVGAGVSSIEQACFSCKHKISPGRPRKAEQCEQETVHWMIEPSMIAQEFNALFEEWEQSRARRDCSVNPQFEQCCDARFIERELASARWDRGR